MTAEVIIMNKLAIALAADSAVTYRVFQGNSQKQKIYQTTNKLFMLSKYHPVSIMIYGAAELNNVPWEVIIKIYRGKLGERNFNTLLEFVDSFVEFLGSFISDDEQRKILEQRLNLYYRYSIKQNIDAIIDDNKNKNIQLSDSDKQKIVSDEITRHHQEMTKLNYLQNRDDKFAEEIIKKYTDIINKSINEIFGPLNISQTSNKLLVNLAGLLFVKHTFPGDASGIVVAGYGNDEYYPVMANLTIDCVINSKLKYSRNDVRIDSQNSSTIIPFAQEEMVHTFISGIDPVYIQNISDYLSTLFYSLPELLLDKIPNNLSKDDKIKTLQALRSACKSELDKFYQDLEKHKVEDHIIPVMSAVNILPKDELATMAEMLVNLTSVKRRVSMQDETVGGPIDVAIISKSDGFVWIKRKHYFDPALNHHFFENYYKGCP